MFGPTPRLHHREPAFAELHASCDELWRQRFDVPPDYDILFVTGSGTLAIECVFASLLPGLALSVDDPGATFGGRLARLLDSHGKMYRGDSPELAHGTCIGDACVQYETAESRHNEFTGRPPPFFVDAVSAFPYYPMPSGTAVLATVTSKQLGTSPGLSVVIVDRTVWRYFRDGGYSYLNLHEYRDRQRLDWQTPHTPAIGIMEELRDRLRGFDVVAFRRLIDARRTLLLDAGLGGHAIGTGPVLTLAPGTLPEEFARRWGLYQSSVGRQLFLWSERTLDYFRFVEEWRRQQHASGV